MQIIDGKKTASEIKAEIAEEVKKIKQAGGKIPHLAAILVGTDGASETYVNYKIKDCEEVGFKSTHIRLDDTIQEEELLNEVRKINKNKDIDGGS